MVRTAVKEPKNPYDIVLRIIYAGTCNQAENDAQVSGISEEQIYTVFIMQAY
jgi:hypothetical protein